MIRHAAESDLPRILEIYDIARQFMRQSGNMTQWINGYPSEPLLRQDITNGDLYVMEDEGGVYCVFALVMGDDPTYAEIEGAWQDTATPYGTIHRLASKGTAHGVARACFSFCLGIMDYVRIDTHENNHTMQAAITGYGFRKCGNIYASNGTLRTAYDFIRP